MARHRNGSLDSIVALARRRNLMAPFALVELVMAAAVALVRLTRKSRQLAETQLQFVAGISHELRTPLTVIIGAWHNLLEADGSGAYFLDRPGCAGAPVEAISYRLKRERNDLGFVAQAVGEGAHEFDGGNDS